MTTLSIENRTCRLFGSDNPDCLLIQPSARHETATLEAEAAQIAALSRTPFVLATVELEDWIIDLMPWPDRNISREEEAGRHAPDTLHYILDALIPELKRRFGDRPIILGSPCGRPGKRTGSRPLRRPPLPYGSGSGSLTPRSNRRWRKPFT